VCHSPPNRRKICACTLAGSHPQARVRCHDRIFCIPQGFSRSVYCLFIFSFLPTREFSLSPPCRPIFPLVPPILSFLLLFLCSLPQDLLSHVRIFLMVLCPSFLNFRGDYPTTNLTGNQVSWAKDSSGSALFLV